MLAKTISFEAHQVIGADRASLDDHPAGSNPRRAD
jgi:hypothetical protein